MTEHQREADASIIQMKSDLAKVKDAVMAMKEIIEALNNAKGFVQTIKVIGGVLKWIALVGGSIGALWLFLKTGHWVKPE